MRRLAMLALAAFCVSAAAPALPARSQGQIDFWVDGAAFASKDGRTWQEIYWSFSPLQLGAGDSLGRRTASFRTAIVLTDSAGRVRLNEDWRTAAPMPDSAVAAQRSMLQLDQMAVSDLEPGRHQLKFVLTDLVSGRQGQVEAQLEVPRFRAGETAVSQIELASAIAADSAPSRFRKGGLAVRPCPDRTFGSATGNRLYYYAEVYNPGGRAVTARAAYSSSQDPTLRVVDSESLAAGTGTVVKYGGIQLEDLANGYYRLWVQAVDSGGRVLASSQANFRVHRDPLEALPQQRKIMEEQASLEREGGEYYDKIELIATQSQLAAYAKLSPAGRKEFLRQFWKRRDPDPETPENEALREHARRYLQADSDYREQNRPGRDTDRGKAFISYGPPDEVEKKLLESNTNDVLIWKYQNGQVLMFLDRLGVGRFELVYDKKNPSRSDATFKKLIEQ